MVIASPAIKLQSVQMSLSSGAGRVDILRGIDLTVADGETVAILGPSGSGKSSLMAVMAGLERASSGSAKTGWPAPGAARSASCCRRFTSSPP